MPPENKTKFQACACGVYEDRKNGHRRPAREPIASGRELKPARYAGVLHEDAMAKKRPAAGGAGLRGGPDLPRAAGTAWLAYRMYLICLTFVLRAIPPKVLAVDFRGRAVNRTSALAGPPISLGQVIPKDVFGRIVAVEAFLAGS